MSTTDSRIRALVVDDEAPARHLLREYLSAHQEVEVVGECANGFEVLKAVAELRPDLLFLDIQMPKLDGFEVLELLGDERPEVIFVTAYDRYALQAFEVHAVDYLLKPFRAERLAEALERIRRGAAPRELPPAELAQDDYVVFSSGEKKLRKQQTLTELAGSLDPGRFVRIHRSYVLNVDRLERIELYAKDSRVAILRDGSRLPVSRAGYARLRELL